MNEWDALISTNAWSKLPARSDNNVATCTEDTCACAPEGTGSILTQVGSYVIMMTM